MAYIRVFLDTPQTQGVWWHGSECEAGEGVGLTKWWTRRFMALGYTTCRPNARTMLRISWKSSWDRSTHSIYIEMHELYENAS